MKNAGAAKAFIRTCSVLALSVSASAAGNPSVDAGQSQADSQARIRRLEAAVIELPPAGAQPPARADIEQLMRLFNVPGLSVAVIDDFQIVWPKGYGVTETGLDTPVTPRTLFMAASVSKPVTATAALALVEQGRLSLDENVNDKLTTWKVPDNELTKSQKVTLRRILSHSAGLTVHGFAGYTVGDPLPTLVQILDGLKPANNSPIRVDAVPGTQVRYSGGGVTVEQQLLMDVSGKPFPTFMRQIVLDKVGMADSTFEQPLPPARAAMAASGATYDGQPIKGKWPIHPEMAAAGLWTTPTDLSKFAIEIALSKQGKSNRVLSQRLTQLMLTPVLDEAGLGFFLDKETPGQFGHDGANVGFRALLTMNSETGKGAAIMTNSEYGDWVAALLVKKIAQEYGWKPRLSDGGAAPMLMLIAKLRGMQAALERYAEIKKSPGEYKIDEWSLRRVGFDLLFAGRTQDAITVFQRNTQEFPKAASTYEALARAYVKAGQRELAIQNYQMSLKLDPKDSRVADALKKLMEAR